MKQTSIIMIVVVALFVGAISGFVFERQYQVSKAPASNQTGNLSGRSNGQGRGQFSRNGMNVVRGSVASIDKDSLTVQLTDGSSKIVILGTSAKIEQTQAASTSDLKAGEQVLVLGTTNSDGSVTAQNVQINPQFGRGTGQL